MQYQCPNCQWSGTKPKIIERAMSEGDIEEIIKCPNCNEEISGL